ncbi:MAG: hypothetical protein JW838_03725 [Spirochaetes bacterium]|nr:hypothetical protein [Spirochaetota bacterium]
MFIICNHKWLFCFAMVLSFTLLTGCIEKTEKNDRVSLDASNKETKADELDPDAVHPLVVITKTFDASGAQTGQTMKQYGNHAAYQSTVSNLNSFAQVMGIINTAGVTIADHNMMYSKSSGNAGRDGVWLTDDDEDQAYTVNRFDARGVMVRTDTYSDFSGRELVKYTTYAHNPDHTMARADGFRGDGVLIGAMRFGYENRRLITIESFGSDATSPVAEIQLAYDSLGRNASIVARTKTMGGMKNSMQILKTYAWNSLLLTSVLLQEWGGNSWKTVYHSENKLNPATMRVEKTLVTDPSGDPINDNDYNYCTTFRYNDMNLQSKESLYSGDETGLKGHADYRYYISR